MKFKLITLGLLVCTCLYSCGNSENTETMTTDTTAVSAEPVPDESPVILDTLQNVDTSERGNTGGGGDKTH